MVNGASRIYDDALNIQHVAFGLGEQQLVDSKLWAARPMADWRERGYVPDSDDEDDIGFCSKITTDDSQRLPVASVLPKEPELSVRINEVTWTAESESPGGIVPASCRNGALSQEVGNISTRERNSGAGEEWRQSGSVGRTVTGESEEGSSMHKVSRSDLAQSIEAGEELKPASVGDQLQAELEYGLQSVRDILGDAPMNSRSKSVGRSQSSSPLSSIRSFADDYENRAAAGESRPEPIEADQAGLERRMSLDRQGDYPPRHLGRDLRRRNPIQLHPYALEDARYQQELKAHGLKPVRIAFDSSGIARDKASDDSQEQDLLSSSPTNDSAQVESFAVLDSTLHSQNIGLSQVSTEIPFPKPQAGFDSDEELPELSAILEGNVPHLHARKRRKIARNSPKETRHYSRQGDFHIPALPQADLDRAVHTGVNMDILEIPPSPPRSGSSNVSVKLIWAREMSGTTMRMTPRGLPTPAASSLLRAPPKTEIETGYSSDPSEDSGLDSSSVTRSSPPVPGRRQQKGIQTMRRRIKGVLPASWLTLDLDKQTSKTTSTRPVAGSPIKEPGAKGVAQRVKSVRSRTSLAEGKEVPVIDLSDGSSSETATPPLAKARSGWASNLFDDDDVGEVCLEDVAEDNIIDVMAPPLSRTRTTGEVPTGRQRKLDETFYAGQLSHAGHSEVRQTMHNRKPQSTPSGKVQRHRKHTQGKSAPAQQPKRILDAPAFSQGPAADHPRFLRIATRRARTHKDKGWQGQWQSTLSISQTDRLEVSSRPLDGHESSVEPQRGRVSILGRTSTQRPLARYRTTPQTSDSAGTPLNPTSAISPDEFATLKNSTASTIRRLVHRQLGSPASSTLHAVTDAELLSGVRAAAHTILPRRLFSHYQNRSGKGRITSSLAPGKASRPAQLEASQVCTSRSHLVSLENQSVNLNSTVSTAAVSHPAEPQRPPRRKRVPQYRMHHGRGSASAGDCSTAELEKGDIMDLRPGTFFQDLTFAGHDDLVRVIRKVRETGYDSSDYVNLVQLLRTYYGNNNMDEPFAERSSITREFLESYRGHGTMQLPTNGDLGFDAFLKLVIITGSQKASSGEKPSSLSNFIFSLIPNSGQLLRKDQDLDSWALRPLQNRHDLYSALYFIAPLETKIRLLPQISSLVDLRESHISACTISLRTLVRLVRFQIATDENPCVLYSFGRLFQAMIKKMEEQFDAARVEALTQLGGTFFRQDSLRRIMRFNQDKIQNFLASILEAWSDCIRSCRTADQARYLLFGDNLGAVLRLCNRTIALDTTPGRDGGDTEAFRDEVIELILSTIASYTINWLPVANNVKECIEELHLPLKDVLSTQLGRHEQCSDGILRSLTHCWHALAKVSVHHGLRSWDNYLSLGGRDAWASFDDTWPKRHYELYFAARFVESSQSVWRDWQIPLLDLWIRSLLVPETSFKYQADLTEQIMRHDASWNPLLFHLPLAIYHDTGHVHVRLEDLVAARTALVLALVRNMNSAMTSPDSQDSFFGLIGPTEDDYSAILKSMMTAMKQYLSELEEKPAEQRIYGDFVSLVLSKMRVCTGHLEAVPDDFEYAPGRFLPMAPDTVKAKLGVYRQQIRDGGMEKHMIVFLHTAAERAAITGQQEAFQKQLVEIFLDLTPESLEDTQGYAADARFRTLFFQNVFPAYLDRIFYGSGFIIARPALACILGVYRGLRFRFGLWAWEYLDPFLTATLSLLATLKGTLVGSITSPERILTDARQLSAYRWLCSIVCEMLSRCQEMEDSFGLCDTLSAVWEYFLFFYQFTLKVAFRPPYALPEELCDEDDYSLLSEPRLSAADDNMLAYSRRELGDILDSKWVPGCGGTWFAQRAGGRREEVHAAGDIGSLEQETYLMQAAARRYVQAFAQGWNPQ